MGHSNGCVCEGRLSADSCVHACADVLPACFILYVKRCAIKRGLLPPPTGSLNGMPKVRALRHLRTYTLTHARTYALTHARTHARTHAGTRAPMSTRICAHVSRGPDTCLCVATYVHIHGYGFVYTHSMHMSGDSACTAGWSDGGDTGGCRARHSRRGEEYCSCEYRCSRWVAGDRRAEFFQV